MFNLEEKYQEFMNEQLQPHIFGTKLIENELNEIGIVITDEQRESFIKSLKDKKNTLTFDFTDEQVLQTGCLSEDELKPKLEKMINELPNIAKTFFDNFQDFSNNIVIELIEDFSSLISSEMNKIREDVLISHDIINNNFVDTIYNIWGKSLTSLKELIILQSETIEMISKKYNKNAEDLTVYVLLNIYARSNQIAKEILILLENGFADGAEARWRTLHELVVTSAFIVQYKEDVAERYIDYQGIEVYRAATKYNEHFDRIGGDKISEKEFKEIENEYNNLIKKYGKEFKNSYGWASNALNLNKRLTFEDIEKSVEFDHYRPHYKSASYNIHANPYGVFSRLGLLEQENLLLSEGSYIGLSEPGQAVAISLNQIITFFFTYNPTIDSLVICKIIEKKSKDVVNNFHKEEEFLLKSMS